MQLDELKDKYKALPLWARLLACALLGIAPAAYIYIDESEILATQEGEATTRHDAAHRKFEAARSQKANIRKLEEQKQFTQEQLFKIKKRLPDFYRIEEILERTATIAKETGVKLMRFNPGIDAQAAGGAQYVELPIATELNGRFSQVAAFFDRVVHLDSSIFLKKIELTREPPAQGGGAAVEAKDQSAHQKALAARRDVKINAKFDLVVYRSMTDRESADGFIGTPTASNQPRGVPPPPRSAANP